MFELAKLPSFLQKISVSEGSEKIPDDDPLFYFRKDKVISDVRRWIFEQLDRQRYNFPTRPSGVREVLLDIPELGPMGRRVLLHKGDSVELPEKPIVVGGMCCLYTPEAEAMRKGSLTFVDTDHVGDWMMNWYPRMDQLDGAVGIPPVGCEELVYVVEDDTWAEKLLPWLLKRNPDGDFTKDRLANMFRTVHNLHGHPALLNWLRINGYNGSVRLVYTSEMKEPYERLMMLVHEKRGHKGSADTEGPTRVALLYDSAWIEALGLDPNRVVIYEPANHIYYEDGILQPPKGLHKLGYIPHWSGEGATRDKPLEEVINRGNASNFRNVSSWDSANILFDPDAFESQIRIYEVLRQVYSLPDVRGRRRYPRKRYALS